MHTDIIRYHPGGEDNLLTGKLVECYREVFADRPWNEFLKCPECEKYWGHKDLSELTANQFRHCGVPLIDFWSREQVLTDIVHEITADASCWLSITSSRSGLTTGAYRVVGFCWGYPITIAELKEKLGIQFSINGNDRDETVAYQDEVGVSSPYQGRGIAKSLVHERLKDFLGRGLKFGVVRTRETPEPSVTFSWYTKKLGYEILARYPGDDGRVILGRSLEGLEKMF